MINDNFSLTAISPIDGRYAKQTEALRNYFSEKAFIKYRVRVEIEYFIALCDFNIKQLPLLSEFQKETLRNIYLKFNDTDALSVKEIEKTTNHDVKAVEYFIKNKFDEINLGSYKEFVHFGLTSQDINNTSQPLMFKEALEDIYLPKLWQIIELLEEKENEWRSVPMLARTHGQPASPTMLGKEIRVFSERLGKQLFLLSMVPFSAKFGGATGNFNAHKVAFPEKDWVSFANTFVNDVLGLDRSQTTTQIEHYDNLAAALDCLKRINTILTDFCRDMWTYISMEYFKQRIKEGEVGSSAMPHKVNPIDFENAEGNLGIANTIFEHLSAKLPISRLQRDLTDSTVCRNMGVPIAHSLLALCSIEKGIGKLLLNIPALERDLENNWAVVAEAVQTVLRSISYPNPYEALKALTRTQEGVTKKTIREFIETLDVDETVKDSLRKISPFTYTGVFGLSEKE